MSDALLDVRDLSVRTLASPHTTLVNEVSFSLHAGEAFTLLGESGSGKSLLAQAIMGNLPNTLQARGVVRVGKREMRAEYAGEQRALWGRELALLPQEPWAALDPTMRALPQVAETYQLVRGYTAQDAAARATSDLERLGLSAHTKKFPHLLSGGMAQRVAFGATVAGGAPILIVDEPTKALDHALRDQIVGLLKDVLAAGGAVFVITHDVSVPRSLGGTVAVMRDAQILEIGQSDTVLQQPAHSYTRALLAAEPERWPITDEASPCRDGDPASREPLLIARALTQRFGEHTLFQNVDVALQRGERVSITGPSGSGKTTLGNVLLGLRTPSAGSVTRARELNPQAFQKLYQDPLAAFAPQLQVRVALRDLMQLHRLRDDAYLPWLEKLGLNEALLDRLPAQVSGGELQRIALARILALQPALIFADEPTSRLDPISQQQTMALLTSSIAEQGGALVLVTHDPFLAQKLTHRRIDIGKT
jgi:peptide/nickel transport system ATP-binding protein